MFGAGYGTAYCKPHLLTIILSYSMIFLSLCNCYSYFLRDALTKFFLTLIHGLLKNSDSRLVACLCKYFSASLDMWCSDFIVHKPHTCGHKHMLHICTHTRKQTQSCWWHNKETQQEDGNVYRHVILHVFK